MSITKSRAKFLCFQLEKKSKESIKKKKKPKITVASKHISVLVQVRESLCIKQNSLSHGRAFFFPFLSLRRLFVSALGVPDGKVSSLEAAVLANYLTAV